MKYFGLLFSGMLVLGANAQQIKHVDAFPSKYVTSRHLDIWFPPDYGQEEKLYPVLYMHDGQMLYDSTATWNKQEWGVDDHMLKLIKAGAIHSAIVVGIWNGGANRHREYFPEKAFKLLPKATQDSLMRLRRSVDEPLFNGPIASDDYLKFLVKELIPYMEENFRVASGKQNRFLMGSSMGGLISMYALCEYPDVFGGAACLSTHWPGIFPEGENPVPAAFLSYLDRRVDQTAGAKWYFDLGTETLDQHYPPLQAKVDALFVRKGLTDDGEQWHSQVFKGDAHDERSWNRRLDTPLIFLLGK